MNSSLHQLCLAAVVAFCALLTSALGDDPAKSDQELLQGTWVCTETIKDGEKVPTYVGVRAVIDGDNLTWYYPKKDGTFNSEKCKFHIDADRKHFDWWRPAKPESVEMRLYTVTETGMRMATNLDYKTRPAAIDQGTWQFTCERLPDSDTGAPGGSRQKIAGWGEVVDPAGDCRIAEAKGRLTITVPGTYHDLTPEPGYDNLDAPRVLQDVDGDFEVQVLVRKFARPLPRTAANPTKPHSFVSSGLLVWQEDGKKFIRLDRATTGDSKFLAVQGTSFSGEKKVANGRSDISDEDVWLRVSRRGGKLSLFRSAGKTWTPVVMQGEDLTLPSKVRIGVFTINATNREITHQFEGFSLKATAPPNRP